MADDKELARRLIRIARELNVPAGGALMISSITRNMPLQDDRVRAVAYAMEHGWIRHNGGVSYTIEAKGLAGLE